MMDDKTVNIRRKRLREWMDKNGLTNSELATRLGVGRAYVSSLFNPERHFGEKAARSIEEKLFMAKGHLDRENPKMAPVDVWEDPGDLPEGVYALVPRVGVRLSAGDGIEALTEDDLPPLAFRESWLRKKRVTSRSNLRVMEVDGPSMEPYLYDSDVVLIDLGQRDVIDGDAYAIRYGNDLRIKRLYKRFDGGLRIVSDNREFPEELLAPSDMEHVEVIGREIWRAG